MAKARDIFTVPVDCTAEYEYAPAKHPLAHLPSRDQYDIDRCLLVQQADQVANLTQFWRWPGRIPLSTLTLIAGDPSLGKSLLTVELATRVSRGIPWPDCPEKNHPPGSVVIISGEDSYRRTIRPRLELHGADMRRISFVEGVGNHCGYNGRRWNQPFVIPDDVPGLEKMLDNVGPCALAIIDPLSAACRKGGTNDMSTVRQMLRPLELCAENTAAAIVCVTHLNKSTGRSGMYRVMGSLGFTAAARAVWGVARDEHDPQRRLFLPVKFNLGEMPGGLAFRIVGGKIEWEPESVDLTWDAALERRRERTRTSPQRDRALAWLYEQLSPGDRPARDLLAASSDVGISARTLERAKDELHLNAYFEGVGKEGRWMWGLRWPSPGGPEKTGP